MMFRFVKKLRARAGLPPGAAVQVGEGKSAPIKITVIDYDEASVEERVVESVEDCAPFRDKPTVTWINIDGVHDARVIEKLGSLYGFHPIVQEDIVTTGLRPKMHDFGDYLFIILKMLYYEPGRLGVKAEQVSLILGTNFVISFQEDVGDVFDVVRERIRSGTGRIRRLPADYLLFSLIDAVVDGYFIVCERFGDEVELVQEKLLHSPTPENLHTIQFLKGEIIELRRSVWPFREVVANLGRGESPLVHRETLVFLRSVYDHTIEVIETIESFRDLVAGMIDIYLSNVSVKLNEVMKVLTIIATIFIPLSFIVGVYGMNFRRMPELGWRFGYPAVLLGCAAVAIGMLIYFRRKRWL
jgi:magnesium transporter